MHPSVRHQAAVLSDEFGELLQRGLTTGPPPPSAADNAVPDRPSATSSSRGAARSDGSGQAGAMAALIPLMTGGRIAGAIWVTRSGGGGGASSGGVAAGGEGGGRGPASAGARGAGAASVDEPPQPTHMATQVAAAAAAGAGPQPTPPVCPSVLTSGPPVLAQLEAALCASLLGGDGSDQLCDLRECVAALAGAGSMQQLLGALCDGAVQHVRRRFLLDARVVAALVAEPAAAVGLMFSWDAAAAEAVTAAAPPSHPSYPLREASSMLLDTGDGAEGHHALSRLLGGNGDGSGAGSSCLLMRVQQFPVAHTLLGRLLPDDHVMEGPEPGTEGRGTAAMDSRRVEVALVENCMAFVQDARNPARDVLLLLAHPDGAPAAGEASRRGVAGSLLLLALPAGDGHGTLGLYVLFPQTLPRLMLRHVREAVVELLQVLYPLVAHRLTGDLAAELAALSEAAAPPRRTARDSPGAAGGYQLPGGGSLVLTASGSTTVTPAVTGRVLQGPLLSPEDVRPSRSSRNASACRVISPFDLAASVAAAAGEASYAHGQSQGWGAATRAGNPSDAIERQRVYLQRSGTEEGETPSLTTLSLSEQHRLLGPRAIASPVGLPALPPRSRSTSVIFVEQLNPAHTSMRTHVPLLVASLQSSIHNARLKAAVAAAAALVPGASAAYAGSRPLDHTALAAVASPRLGPASAGSAAADRLELSSLELRSRIGAGGCAVVFKGRFGTVDCAVKVMEMPDADQHDPELSATAAAPEKEGLGADESAAASGIKLQLSARRALLRNAMEVAALTSISHPNIIQVYSTFNNVTLVSRTLADGRRVAVVIPAGFPEHESASQQAADGDGDGGGGGASSAPLPVCLAIVCEWCDQGSVATALANKRFHRPAPTGAPGGAAGGGISGGSAAAGGSRPHRVLDYRAVLMTLLDVALALRYLHSHNLAHRDVKAANVLLRACPTDRRGFTAKLADFGFVVILDNPGDERNGFEPYAVVDQSCGTVTHMAPECLRNGGRVEAACDVYREMTAAGNMRPYRGIPAEHIPRAVHTGARPAFSLSVPVPYRLLAQHCWAAAPHHRPRSAELVAAISGLLSAM
ncbi:hypothetical protein GPECTOR_21g650 [Gonium pectorale]|uniref:Protein kinase domain-containing protein n=1 Tax=Gonium pectorale TaxID=33097 RepID=A0A150GHY3_GONPE|nr:hypothetical protein GPECTOR_21g650 [Gonium pectorale]|eukprot:KXZ49424.1 hypothetical protein GPECTOR_21g650 [Gonium pectorale]